jgi:hypothetical protein
MSRNPRSRRGSSAVFGVLLLTLITVASGFLFYNFVMTNINTATETFSSQMTGLIMTSFSINATHIVAFLQNKGQKLVEVTTAYINGMVTALVKMVDIAPQAIGTVILRGSFIAGDTYTVKLATIFNVDVTFQASF